MRFLRVNLLSVAAFLIGISTSFCAFSVDCMLAKDQSTLDQPEVCGSNIQIQKLSGFKSPEYNNVEFYRIFGESEKPMIFNEQLPYVLIFYPGESNFPVLNDICASLLGEQYRYLNTSSYSVMTFAKDDPKYKRMEWDEYKSGKKESASNNLMNNRILKSITCRSYTEREQEQKLAASPAPSESIPPKKDETPSKPKQDNEPNKVELKVLKDDLDQKYQELKKLMEPELPIALPKAQKTLFYLDLADNGNDICHGVPCQQYILESLNNILFLMKENQAVNVVYYNDSYAYYVFPEPMLVNQATRNEIRSASNLFLKAMRRRTVDEIGVTPFGKLDRKYQKSKYEFELATEKYKDQYWHDADGNFNNTPEVIRLKDVVDAKEKIMKKDFEAREPLNRMLTVLETGERQKYFNEKEGIVTKEIIKARQRGLKYPDFDVKSDYNFVPVLENVDLDMYDAIYVFSDFSDIGLSKDWHEIPLLSDRTAPSFSHYPFYFKRYGSLAGTDFIQKRGYIHYLPTPFGDINVFKHDEVKFDRKAYTLQMDEFLRFLKLMPSTTYLGPIGDQGDFQKRMTEINAKLAGYFRLQNSYIQKVKSYFDDVSTKR